MGLICVTLRILFEYIGSNTNNSFLQSNHTNACTLNNDFVSQRKTLENCARSHVEMVDKIEDGKLIENKMRQTF